MQNVSNVDLVEKCHMQTSDIASAEFKKNKAENNINEINDDVKKEFIFRCIFCETDFPNVEEINQHYEDVHMTSDNNFKCIDSCSFKSQENKHGKCFVLRKP